MPLGFILMIVFVSYISAREIGEYKKNFSMLAAELGCAVLEKGKWDYPAIAGDYHGRKILIHFVTEGSGKHRRRYLTLTASHRGRVNASINLSLERAGAGLAKMLLSAAGMREVVVGDQDFDSKFLVLAELPDEATRVLNADLRYRLSSDPLPVSINAGSVSYRTEAKIKREEIVRILGILCEIASDLDRA